ncbi:phospholipid scramblase 2-like [Mizuhopecten yessoensis]|uniref:Phospholipid scramblase n=1 Tax=Mizuhopecten yessoensis TaxID=6573 RepID=A0A210PJU3_MIZYE|nr:phospholipid scramblase 2-like [Mizuhopecten yessoensis]OWF36696.1 Phospholipid scramblase 2 [Mizuhopecten yessoensis]
MESTGVAIQMQGGVPPPNVQGLPPGLQYLAGLTEINIHQHLDMLEDTDCCTRQLCGPARPFNMNITDNNFQPLISLYRPLRCQASFLWCCYLQEMDIMSPPGLSVGGLKQIWTPWKPKFQVHDAQQTPLFQIDGECCFCCPCTDIMFTITDISKGQQIGEIVKHWGGCREIFGGVNDFKVTFPGDLDVMSKALLLGATFLIDFNYFEPKKN